MTRHPYSGSSEIPNTHHYIPMIIELDQQEYQANTTVDFDGVATQPIRSNFMVAWSLRNPAHAMRQLFGEYSQPDTDAMALGRLRHSLLLNEVSWQDQYLIIDADSYRTKDAREQKHLAEVSGRTPILKTVFEAQREIMNRLKSGQSKICAKMKSGQVEHGIAWEYDGVFYKALFDSLDRDDRVAYDLKTVLPDRVSGLNKTLRFDVESPAGLIKVGHYLKALQAVCGDKEPVHLYWLLYENVEPHQSMIVQCSSDTGRGLKALHLWEEWAENISQWCNYYQNKYSHHPQQVLTTLSEYPRGYTDPELTRKIS